MIWPNNNNGTFSGVHTVRLVCLPVARVVALIVDICFEQSCVKSVGKFWTSGDEDDNVHFIFHFPVTGVKNSGISFCSTFFLSECRTSILSMTLSGSVSEGVNSFAIRLSASAA